MSSNPPRSAVTPDDVRIVSPALAKYTQASINDDLWRRPELSPRDRSMVTVAALIARNQTIGMLHYFNLALDNGVAPGELSEIVAHLAFYSGWSNAFSAVSILKDIFVQRGIEGINFRKSGLSFFPSMKRQNHNAPPRSSKTLVQSLRAWRSTRQIYFSAIFGYGPV